MIRRVARGLAVAVLGWITLAAGVGVWAWARDVDWFSAERLADQARRDSEWVWRGGADA